MVPAAHPHPQIPKVPPPGGAPDSLVLKLLKNYRATVEITSAPKPNLFIIFQLLLFRSPS